MSRRTLSLEEVWAEKLGLETAGAAVSGELAARFAYLVQFVLGNEMPPAGSAEEATAYGDLWILSGFLTDARQIINGQEVAR
ncbi:hypothetical protein GCM10009554_38780 [Kribbella koreensis]|uniref:Uncharacterized protein n=2 Tax=Kribbella TaxID=182639 RepID=A0ABP6X5Q6_9ACTN